MRKAGGVAAALIALLGGYAVASPYLALWDLEDALREGDAATLEERVNFPHLRENLKSQMKAHLLKAAGREAEDKPFAALGIALSSTLVGTAVDTFVTPKGLADLASGDRPKIDPSGGDARTSSEDDEEADEIFEDARVSHDSLTRFSVWVPDDKGGETQFVFRRDPIRWRLESIFLPDPNEK